MRSLLYITVFFLASLHLAAQDADALRETGRSFMRQGDFPSALQALDKALEIKPDNVDILKDKAFIYYLQRDFASAIAIGKKITASKDADAQCFQILGLAYKAIAETKESEKMYKQALERFPASGALYSDYGEILSAEKPDEAIKYWEKGIESDPAYSGNYYFATKYYGQKGNIIWGLLYGEIFVNIESLSKRTEEIKNILYGGYNKLFQDISILDNAKQNGSAFEMAVAKNLGDLTTYFMRYVVSPEVLTALRTRFLLSWFTNETTRKMPFRLFEYQRNLLRQGYFDAYNQWLTGSAADTQKYQAWVHAHGEEVKGFQQYQRNELLSMPTGQYYAH